MKKAMIGLAAVGAVLALRPLKQRMAQKMREHCRQMAVKCGQMMAGQSTRPGEAAGMPEHCGQPARADEAAGTRKPEPVGAT